MLPSKTWPLLKAFLTGKQKEKDLQKVNSSREKKDQRKGEEIYRWIAGWTSERCNSQKELTGCQERRASRLKQASMREVGQLNGQETEV